MEEYDEAIAVQAAIHSAPQAPAASIPASALAPSQGSEVVEDRDPFTPPPPNYDPPSTFYNAWPQASGDELKQGLPVQSLASSQGDDEQMHDKEYKADTQQPGGYMPDEDKNDEDEEADQFRLGKNTWRIWQS